MAAMPRPSREVIGRASLGDLNSQRETDTGGSPSKGLLTAPQVKLLPISPTQVYQTQINFAFSPPPQILDYSKEGPPDI